jgi:hypothetical protein
MLNKKERLKLQSLLPVSVQNGYRLIKAKLPHLSSNQICQAFLYDNRYKAEVMSAALEVIEEAKLDPIKVQVAAL